MPSIALLRSITASTRHPGSASRRFRDWRQVVGGEEVDAAANAGELRRQQMSRIGMLEALSTKPVLHVLDQGLGPLAPGATIQAELLGFIVVATLYSEGGEGPQWQEAALWGGLTPR